MTKEDILKDIQASPWIHATPEEYFNHARIEGLYLEFGVSEGASIRKIAKLNPARMIYGFDSFKGLPEPWGPSPVGTFKCDPPLINLSVNTSLVIGLFQDTLPHFLLLHPGDASFIHVDSDIYSSAKYVLTTLAERIVDGTLIAFDEIHAETDGKDDHEDRAFVEFLNESGMRYACLGHGTHNALFRMLA